MRTTLTLDDDVAALIERLRKARHATFRDIVNEAIRLGLRQLSAKRRLPREYRMTPVDLGRCRMGSLEKVADALALAEGDSYR